MIRNDQKTCMKHKFQNIFFLFQMFKSSALAILATVLLIEANPLPEGHRGYYGHYIPRARVYHYGHGGGHGFAAGYGIPWYIGSWKPVHHPVKC